MKKIALAAIFGMALIFTCTRSLAQNQQQGHEPGRQSVIFIDGLNKVVSADEVINVNESYEFKGNVQMRDIRPGEVPPVSLPPSAKPQCGSGTKYVCGIAKVISHDPNGKGAIIHCVGTTGRCVKVKDKL